MRVRFRKEAISDLEAARDWYESRRPALGAGFIHAFEQLLDVVREMPEAFPQVDEGVRRALLERFPYAVYYRVDSSGLDVLACLHTSRSTSGWQPRS